jgi:hypothetical protein
MESHEEWNWELVLGASSRAGAPHKAIARAGVRVKARGGQVAACAVTRMWIDDFCGDYTIPGL